MNTDQILSAIILIAVLSLVMPTFLNTNSRLKQFLRNLSIWAVIVVIIVIIIQLNR
tara:strand:- start:85 stop:252 length:168 start_codon:yes stop_codon:yes gene_type:complete